MRLCGQALEVALPSRSSFLPPRCPYSGCRFFLRPQPGFYAPWGSYQPLCRPHRVPRFRCRGCKRTFSRQSFRADYGLHKPHLSVECWRELVSGVSLRQIARTRAISRTTVEDRRDRLGRHCMRLWHRLERLAAGGGRWYFDEMETFESNRRLQPLTVGLLVEGRSGWVGGFEVGRMRSRGGASAASRRRREAFERREGKRAHESGKVVRGCFRRLRGGKAKEVWSDQKGPYVGAMRRWLEGVEHVRIPGRLPKGASHPLFAVNHAAAMARYGMARLIRRTMCTTKDRRRLRLHGALWAVWRNCWRWRRNGARQTPAMVRGVAARRWSLGELFGWRADWGSRSIAVGD